jgi:hypothetical protein
MGQVEGFANFSYTLKLCLAPAEKKILLIIPENLVRALNLQSLEGFFSFFILFIVEERRRGV